MKAYKFLIAFLAIFLGYSHSSFSQSSDGSLSPKEEKLIRKTVKIWSDAHDKWDYKDLKDLYADTLIFYTQKLPAGTVLSKITNMFRPSEAFRHKIISDIDLNLLPNGYIKCNFTKEVTTKGKTKSYPSYLVLESKNDEYVVKAEGDYITDKNLHYNYDEYLNAAGPNGLSKVSTGSNYFMYLIIASVLFVTAALFYFKSKKKAQPLNSGPLKETETVKEPVEIKEPSMPKESYVEQNEDPNKKKGDEFEKYVVSKFNKAYFRSLAWRSDKAAHGHFPESNKYPDLEFEFSHNDYVAEFAVECKYRSNYNSGYIDLGDYSKLSEYRKFERKRKVQVYIVLGVGGQPSDPEDLFVIPLPDVTSNKIHRNQLQNEHRKSTNSNFYYNRNIHLLT